MVHREWDGGPSEIAGSSESSRLRFLVEGSTDAVFLTDADGAITYVNPAFERLYGLSSGDMVGRVPHVLDADGVGFALDQEFWAKLLTPQVVALDVLSPTRHGSAVHVEGTANPVVDDRGEVVGFIAVHRPERPVSPRMGNEYRGVFEHSPVPTWVVDVETLRFLLVNEAAVAHYGYSRAEFLAMTLADIRDPEEVPALLERIASLEPGPLHDGVWSHRKKDGTPLKSVITAQVFDVRGRRCVLVNAQDLTQQKRLEEQYFQAQKLEAVGRLAGSVAHDFNNLLSVVVSYAALAKESLPEDSQLRDDLEEIEKAAQRATTLTGQLLVFARRQVFEPRVVSLNDSVRSLTKMLGRLLGEDVLVRVIAEPALWTVRVDPGQMDQVLMNLAVNARDAMPDGGTLTIESANVTLDAETAQRMPGAKPGPYVRLAVIDDGVGMPAEVQARIFEPFFTTKDPGKGTGLGLATVLAIIQQWGGSMQVQSEVGRGSRFEVFVPRSAPTRAHLSVPAPVAQQKATEGTETILLVEDDDQLRRLLELVLRKHGYVTLSAANPAEARQLADRYGGSIDLLLTDVVMPVMNGPKLAGLLTTSRPGLRVLYMSGYAGSALTEQGIFDGGATLLRKPISPKELLRSVRDVLDQVLAS